MKKFLSAFLVFIMTVSIFTTISTVTAFAEDDPISAALANIPADAFKGDYTESTASDGSVTRVFRNGGVLTKYADGTSTSVD